jgi:hypothetical protein
MREWTTSGEAVTDADGWISFRGFHGCYSLSSGQGDTEVVLDNTHSNDLVIF